VSEIQTPVPKPGGGKVRINKTVAIVTLAGAAIIGVVWWRQGHDTGAAAATPADAIDPLTGLPYSVESGTDTGLNSGTGHGYDTSPVDANPPSNGVTDIPSWVNDALAKLGATMDAGAVSRALGDYLAQVPLTQDEAAIVRQAWAVSGKWPFLPQSYTLATNGSTPGNPPPSGPPGNVQGPLPITYPRRHVGPKPIVFTNPKLR
jgi:hypothetical protein